MLVTTPVIPALDVESLLEQLTLEEKVALTAGMSNLCEMINDGVRKLTVIREGLLAHSRYSASSHTIDKIV